MPPSPAALALVTAAAAGGLLAPGSIVPLVLPLAAAVSQWEQVGGAVEAAMEVLAQVAMLVHAAGVYIGKCRAVHNGSARAEAERRKARERVSGNAIRTNCGRRARVVGGSLVDPANWHCVSNDRPRFWLRKGAGLVIQLIVGTNEDVVLFAEGCMQSAAAIQGVPLVPAIAWGGQSPQQCDAFYVYAAMWVPEGLLEAFPVANAIEAPESPRHAAAAVALPDADEDLYAMPY